MQEPSENWKRLRRASLERARRIAVEPLETLFTIHLAVCLYYIVGCFCLQFLDQSPTFSALEAVQLLSVAAAGILVPVLTGSVLTLHFADRRLKRLTNG